MIAKDLTLRIPMSLYEQIMHRANERERSIEDETLDLLAAAVPTANELPDDLAAAVAPLELLDDQALADAAKSHLEVGAASELEALHLKRQREGLTAAEQDQMSALVLQYERAMLVRARAAALLHERTRSLPPSSTIS
jgi:plasmid stability protein